MHAHNERVEYQIIDAENPENNALVIPGGEPLTAQVAREQAREDAFQRVKLNTIAKLAEVMLNRRTAENRRTLRAKVTKRRRKEALAKASRKRNRR